MAVPRQEIQATFSTLQNELQAGLKFYWDAATQILDTSSIKVLDATVDGIWSHSMSFP